MKRLCVLFLLVCCSSLMAQTPVFRASLGRLEIPYMTVDNARAFRDLVLNLQPDGSLKLANFEKLDAEWNQARFVELALGESITLNDELSVAFTHVLSDSRCPSDVTCVTDGEVIVILTLTESSQIGLVGNTIFGLSLSGSAPADLEERIPDYMEIRNIFFNLVDVTPYPVSSQSVNDSDYVILLEYTGVPLDQSSAGDE